MPPLNVIVGLLVAAALIAIGSNNILNAERVSLEWHFSEKGGLGVRVMGVALLLCGIALGAVVLLDVLQ